MKMQMLSTQLFGENIFVIWDETSLEAAVIDPGMMRNEEYEELEAVIADRQLKVKYVLLTHAHVDHACAARWTAEKFGAAVHGSMLDAMWANAMPQQAEMFHLPIRPQALTIDHALEEGQVLCLGNVEIQVIATPGHTEGGLVFYAPKDGVAFVGDTIFLGSVGRTDLPGGDMRTLVESIRTKVFALPAETVLYPGHGPKTTVAYERENNPYA
ncbi:MAG: MBL fold metallo-hydrolase [Bacteroidales bacterium]|nr:MBL fold metallo-hydrolase [Bacteroidales bacterium]